MRTAASRRCSARLGRCFADDSGTHELSLTVAQHAWRTQGLPGPPRTSPSESKLGEVLGGPRRSLEVRGRSFLVES